MSEPNEEAMCKLQFRYFFYQGQRITSTFDTISFPISRSWTPGHGEKQLLEQGNRQDSLSRS